jgi:3-hydroxyisobutyrate dehydrogenase-like beta-hydroxyacid dehydrogenase
MIDDDHSERIDFTPVLRLKDVDYALMFARTLGMASPFGALAAHQFRQLCELGFLNVNESQVIEVSRRAKSA